MTRNGEAIGRNDKCPCGSGKKYKQCCIRNATFGLGRAPLARPGVKHKKPKMRREVHDTLTQVQSAVNSLKILVTGLVPETVASPMTTIDAMRRVGLAEKFIYAYQQTGLLLTTVNKQLHPPEDVAKWDAAIAEYEAQHPEEANESGSYSDQGGPRTDPARASSDGDDGGLRPGCAVGTDDAGHQDAAAARETQAGGDAGVS